MIGEILFVLNAPNKTLKKMFSEINENNKRPFGLNLMNNANQMHKKQSMIQSHTPINQLLGRRKKKENRRKNQNKKFIVFFQDIWIMQLLED